MKPDEIKQVLGMKTEEGQSSVEMEETHPHREERGENDFETDEDMKEESRHLRQSVSYLVPQ